MRRALKELGQTPLDHPGLLLQRYYPARAEGESDEALHGRESQWRKELAQAKGPEAYRPAFERWTEALHGMGADLFEADLVARMTVSLGTPSPSENGLALHHTYGIPYVPGSTLKGAMRAIAQEMLNLPDLDPTKKSSEVDKRFAPILSTFGSVENMAAVTVFDAMWVPDNRRPPLVREAWTPHHQSYMTGSSALPLESEAPIPLSLFAVPAGTKFRFALLLPGPEWRGSITSVLDRTLHRGVGAKHHQGYGRFGEVRRLS